MRKFRGINAEHKLQSMRKALSFLVLTAHADEGDTTEGGNSDPKPSINYEQLISQARKEEKEKLYPRIKKLEEDNANLVKTGNDNLIKIGDLMKTIETLQVEIKGLKEKGEGEDSETVTKLKAEIEALKSDNEKLKSETPNEEEIRKQIEAEYEVKMYATEQQTANKDEILSSFLPEVVGKTKEEIDEAVKKAKEKTIAIKKDLGLVDEEGKPVDKFKPSKSNKEKTKTPPKTNPTYGDEHTAPTFDPEYIRNLDPASEEYKEFRKSLGLK